MMASVSGPQPAESLKHATVDAGTTNRWVHTQCAPKLKPAPVLELKNRKGSNEKKARN